jgi:hypothetical protein
LGNDDPTFSIELSLALSDDERVRCLLTYDAVGVLGDVVLLEERRSDDMLAGDDAVTATRRRKADDAAAVAAAVAGGDYEEVTLPRVKPADLGAWDRLLGAGVWVGNAEVRRKFKPSPAVAAERRTATTGDIVSSRPLALEFNRRSQPSLLRILCAPGGPTPSMQHIELHCPDQIPSDDARSRGDDNGNVDGRHRRQSPTGNNAPAFELVHRAADGSGSSGNSRLLLLPGGTYLKAPLRGHGSNVPFEVELGAFFRAPDDEDGEENDGALRPSPPTHYLTRVERTYRHDGTLAYASTCFHELVAMRSRR